MPTNKNPFSLTAIAQRVAHAFDRKGARNLDKPQAGPQAGTGAVRKVAERYQVTGMTTEKLVTLLANAADLTDIAPYLQLAESIEELDLEYRSLIQTRKLAIAGLDWDIQPFDSSAQAKQVAELVRTVLTSEKFKGAVLDILDGISKGFSVVEILWDTSGPQWVPASYEHRPAHWFVFDKEDGTTLKLRGENNTTIDLEARRFIVHKPSLKSGLPIRSGLARAAAYGWLIKAIVLTDWLAFCEVFGQPFRVGKYQKGANSLADAKALKKALEVLGTDAYAVIPNDMTVEFVNAGGAAGNAQLFDRIIQYIDSQLAKLVLGQTLTSGSGDGSNTHALGKVHNEVRGDILRADAVAFVTSVVAGLIRPLVDFNFGAEVPLPALSLQIEEPEDLVGLATIIEKLAPLGAEVPTAWMHKKFGIPQPQNGEPVLTPRTPAAPPAVPGADEPAAEETAAQSRRLGGCPVHASHRASGQQRDALDDQLDVLTGQWVPVSEGLQAKLLAAISGAKNEKELVEKLEAFVRKGNVRELAQLVAHSRAIARVVAEAEGDIGGGTE